MPRLAGSAAENTPESGRRAHSYKNFSRIKSTKYVDYIGFDDDPPLSRALSLRTVASARCVSMRMSRADDRQVSPVRNLGSLLTSSVDRLL